MIMLDFFVSVSALSSSLSFSNVSIGNLNLAIVYIQILSFEGMTLWLPSLTLSLINLQCNVLKTCIFQIKRMNL